ncbi:MAG: hypothetical protein AAGK22_27290, partial [Acidobacteriota bacterium]
MAQAPSELYLHTFFIVTSFTPEEMCARDVLDFYRAQRDIVRRIERVLRDRGILDSDSSSEGGGFDDS